MKIMPNMSLICHCFRTKNNVVLWNLMKCPLLGQKYELHFGSHHALWTTWPNEWESAVENKNCATRSVFFVKLLFMFVCMNKVVWYLSELSIRSAHQPCTEYSRSVVCLSRRLHNTASLQKQMYNCSKLLIEVSQLQQIATQRVNIYICKLQHKLSLASEIKKLGL